MQNLKTEVIPVIIGAMESIQQ